MTDIKASFNLNKSLIATDLTKESPQWLLSAYGPGKDAPRQLFGGHPREQSFEELRLHHYQLAAQGKQQQAIEESDALISNAKAQMQNAVNDVDGAIKYILDGEHDHPNRIDVCKVESGRLTQHRNTAPGIPPISSFNQSAANRPAFGQQSAPSMSGRPVLSAFGQPSFGQPSTFGKPSSSTPTFGQPSVSGSSGFLQSSSSSNALSANPFQVASGPSQGPMMNQSTTQPNPGLFGQSSVFSTTSPFSQSSTQLGNSTSPKTAAPQNPFTNSTASRTSLDGRASTSVSDPFASKVSASQDGKFVQSLASASAPKILNGQQWAGARVRKDANGKLTSWNGNAVSYIDGEPCYKATSGAWQKIWFPDGVPTFVNSVDIPEDRYNSETKENYAFLRDNGAFKNGVIPLLPPKREWCSWNL